MSVYDLHVNGSERYAKLSSFRAELVLNGHDNIIAFILPSEGSPEIRFNLDDEVELLKDSTAICGGIVTHVGEEMEPEGGPNNNGRFLSRITVSGWGEIASRRHVSMSVVGGSPGTTLADGLADLIALDLGADGVTLHPSQDAGDVLPAMLFEDELPSAILNRWALITGRVWRIDEQKRLRMWAKGDIAAPFDIDEFDLPAKYFGDIRPSRSRFDGYANRVIVKGTKQTILDYGETHVSTGVETSFATDADIIGARGALKITNVPSLGVPADSALWESVRMAGTTIDTPWEADPETRTFTRLSGVPLPSGAIIRIIFDAEVSPRGVANDLVDQAAHPVRDEIAHAPVATDAECQTLAAQILPYVVAAKETKAAYSTRETDLILPGDTQTMTVPGRGLSGAFLVERVSLRSGPGEMNTYLVQDIETTQNQVLKGDWRDLLNQFTVGPSGSTVTGGKGDSNNTGGDVTTNPDGDAGSGGALAIPPDDTDVIFNKRGALGTHRTGGSPAQQHIQVLHSRILGGSPVTVEDMVQFLLTTLDNNPFDSLQKWCSPNNDGVVTLTPWYSTYPGEMMWGAEMAVDQTYIARSTAVLIISVDLQGSFPFASLTFYRGQTPGDPLDFSEYQQFNFNWDTTLNAGGVYGIESTERPSVVQTSKVAVRDQLGTGSFGISLTVDGTHTALREIKFKMGDANRTIRFDGVGSNVTFT